jgi:hypothetical protein
MGLLDYFADRSFRDDPAGRVVIFTGAASKRGYLVKSADNELKIRSFLKMFCFAQLSIQLLGMLLANSWSTEISHAFGRPAEHLFKVLAIYLGIYSLVVLVPFLLLWKSFQKEVFRFVSPEDAVVVTGKPSKDQRVVQTVALVAGGFLILLGAIVFLLVSRR